MRLCELTSEEVRSLLATNDPTAVLPTGSTEQHGPHLPVDTDVYLAEQVALAACSGGPDIVLPPVCYGYNEKELDFVGTVSLPARTFLDMIEGVGRSLRRSGWSRLLIVNGHGWNNDLMRAATHVLNEQSGLIAACCCYWDLCRAEVAELRSSPVPGGMAHGGEFETSLMLHLRPDAVRRDRMVDEISFRRTSHHHHDLFQKSAVFIPERFTELSRSGVMGVPSHASSEKGGVWFQAAVRHLREFLDDFRGEWPAAQVTTGPSLPGRPQGHFPTRRCIVARMSVELRLAKGINALDLQEALTLEERWKLARRSGMTDLGVLVDPDDPTTATLDTTWTDMASAKEFLQKFQKTGADKRYKRTGDPVLRVSPTRLQEK